MNAKSTTRTKQPDRDEAPHITVDWAAKAELRRGDVVLREATPPVRIGRPPKAEHERKRQVTLRLEPTLLARMRLSGKGWQVRAEDVLRKEFLGNKSANGSVAALGRSLAEAISKKASKSPGERRAVSVKLRRSSGRVAGKKSA